ncbi:hypothetical protein PIROE2DRAFT_2776 [Piromyces sp. E2]|nr:hypothetical protein PIROE2DRAFT_2776 [Piromyces sp. E2]|eukprot:OUM69278.1 hypothetical protein PIROE2DRAFT_2776 [Piromyces sp. E2]
MVTYGPNENFLKKYDLEFNYTTYFFNNYEEMNEITGIIKVELCRAGDMPLLNDENRNILLWNTANEQSRFKSSSEIHIVLLWKMSDGRINFLTS